MNTNIDENANGDTGNSQRPVNNASGARPPMDPARPHLLIETAGLLSASIADRVKRINEEKFIMHANARDVLSKLKEIWDDPVEVTRPSCLSIIGASNQGKSATVNQFAADFAKPVSELFTPEEEVPLLVANLPERPAQGAVGSTIARGIGLRMPARVQARVITDNVMRALENKKTRMVVLCEFQHVKSLPSAERQVVYDLVKNISSAHVHVVLVGTDAMRNYLIEDDQILNRFRPIKLVPMALGEEFKKFLCSLEAFYPLPDPSDLFGHARFIHSTTGGITGEVVTLCNTAAKLAVRKGAKRIELEHLTTAKPLPLASAA